MLQYASSMQDCPCGLGACMAGARARCTSDMAAASAAVRYQLLRNCAIRASSFAPKGRSSEAQHASTAWSMLVVERSLLAVGAAEYARPAH